jgi:hypothetical protein
MKRERAVCKRARESRERKSERESDCVGESIYCVRVTPPSPPYAPFCLLPPSPPLTPAQSYAHLPFSFLSSSPSPITHLARLDQADGAAGQPPLPAGFVGEEGAHGVRPVADQHGGVVRRVAGRGLHHNGGVGPEGEEGEEMRGRGRVRGGQNEGLGVVRGVAGRGLHHNGGVRPERRGVEGQEREGFQRNGEPNHHVRCLT